MGNVVRHSKTIHNVREGDHVRLEGGDVYVRSAKCIRKSVQYDGPIAERVWEFEAQGDKEYTFKIKIRKNTDEDIKTHLPIESENNLLNNEYASDLEITHPSNE